MATDSPIGWDLTVVPATPPDDLVTPLPRPPRIGDALPILVLTGFAIVVVSGYVILQALGRDVGAYTVFLSGPVVTGVVGAILARRQEQIKHGIEVVKNQTNGLLTAQFTAQSAERRSFETARRETAQVAEAEASRVADELHEPPTG